MPPIRNGGANVPSQRRIFLMLALSVVLSCGSGGGNQPPGAAKGTTRVSVATDGSEANSDSFRNAISGDGNVVAFRSRASNLSPLDNTGISNIFLHNRSTGITSLVSVGMGTSADGNSFDPVTDDKGRFVAFQSDATNLVAGDTNGFPDIFVRDMNSGSTILASTSVGGGPAESDSYFPSLSGDGRFLAFVSFADNLTIPQRGSGAWDIFVRDLTAGTTERVSITWDNTFSNGVSGAPEISRDGTVVAFESEGENLVPGDNNAFSDVFVRDLIAHVTERVSIAYDNTQGNNGSYRPSISSDGQFVAFRSDADNLVPSDNNAVADIFVRDRILGTTELISVSPGGDFGNGPSNHPAMSADGRYVVFQSEASNLVTGDTNGMPDIFLRDRTLGTTRRISVSSSGMEADGISSECRISSNGAAISMESEATNLVPGDTNGASDVFVVLW